MSVSLSVANGVAGFLYSQAVARSKRNMEALIAEAAPLAAAARKPMAKANPASNR